MTADATTAPLIRPSARVSPTATLAPDVVVLDGAVVEPGAVVPLGVVIAPGVVIAAGRKIGLNEIVESPAAPGSPKIPRGDDGARQALVTVATAIGSDFFRRIVAAETIEGPKPLLHVVETGLNPAEMAAIEAEWIEIYGATSGGVVFERVS